MPAPISVRQDESGYFWCVSYTCCETPRTRFHEWSLAQLPRLSTRRAREARAAA